jgi:sugar lactone lactonase YvrE
VRFVLLLLVLALAPVTGAQTFRPPELIAVVPTGRAPCGLDTHGGRLWVAVYEMGQVLRLDRAGRIAGRHRVGRWACQIAIDGRAAWVTRDNANQLVRLDLRSGRLRRVAVSSPYDVEVAARSVWVTSFETGKVTRLDSAGRVTRVFEVGGNPTGVAWCGGRMWVGHGREGTWVTAIDPGTGAVTRVEVATRSPRWPTCIRGELWVTTENTALRIAPRSGELLGSIPLGQTLAEAGGVRSAGGGSPTVWVTDKEHSVIHRIEPTSGRVLDSVAAGPGALGIESFAGSVWVTSFAGSDVRRFVP